MKQRIRTSGAAAGLALMLCCLAFASPAAAANSVKPYSTVICGNGQINCSAANPAVVAPGGTASNPSALTVTFANLNKPGSGIRLGSDNLNVPATPAGFSVVGTSLPACPPSLSQQGSPCFYLYDSSGNLSPSGGTTVGFRNLNLAATQSITVTLYAITPAPSATACTTTSPCFWSDEAKQSNDFSGTGNDLGPPGAAASYGTVMTAVAACLKKQGCATKLGDGGTSGDPGGTVSVSINTSGGKTNVTQLQALDFGSPIDPTLCAGVTADHFTFWSLSNGADNGLDRSQTISITTSTPLGYSYTPELCLQTQQQFTMKTAPGLTFSLAPANPLPDGTGYQGLLPDCGGKPAQPNTVDCTKLPGVLSRTNNGNGTSTTVAAIPPGFDARAYN